MALIGFVGFHFQKEQAVAELENTIQQTADRLAHNIVNPLWNIDRVEIDKIISLEMADRNINAVVLDADIVTIELGFGKYRDVSGQLQSIDNRDMGGIHPETSFLTLGREIQKDGMPLGNLEIIGADRYLKETLRNLVLQISLLTASTGLLVSILTLICLRTMVATKIKPLEDATMRIEHGYDSWGVD